MRQPHYWRLLKWWSVQRCPWCERWRIATVTYWSRRKSYQTRPGFLWLAISSIETITMSVYTPVYRIAMENEPFEHVFPARNVANVPVPLLVYLRIQDMKYPPWNEITFAPEKMAGPNRKGKDRDSQPSIDSRPNLLLVSGRSESWRVWLSHSKVGIDMYPPEVNSKSPWKVTESQKEPKGLPTIIFQGLW